MLSGGFVRFNPYLSIYMRIHRRLLKSNKMGSPCVGWKEKQKLFKVYSWIRERRIFRLQKIRTEKEKGGKNEDLDWL